MSVYVYIFRQIHGYVNLCKMRSKIIKMRPNMANMRPKMAKITHKIANTYPKHPT